MNSRERVSAAIARQPVDRVPLGFYCVDHDTVARVIGRPGIGVANIHVAAASARDILVVNPTDAPTPPVAATCTCCKRRFKVRKANGDMCSASASSCISRRLRRKAPQRSIWAVTSSPMRW